MTAIASERCGRYALGTPIGSGGMGLLRLAALRGPLRFERVVVIKRLHPHLAHDPDFVSMLLDEARIGAGLGHPLVVGVEDVFVEHGELHVVYPYVRGPSLAHLLREARRAGARVSVPVAIGITMQILEALHALHEARDGEGNALGIVHRDVSPQNILVGADGLVRLIDLGIAKSTARAQATSGAVKGKLAYMAPEQRDGAPIDARADLFSAAVVLWEMLAGERLALSADSGACGFRPLPAEAAARAPTAAHDVIERALSVEVTARFASAAAFCDALAGACAPAGVREVAAWVDEMSGPLLTERDTAVRALLASTGELEATLPTEPASGVGRQARHRSRRWPLAIAFAGVTAVAWFLGAQNRAGGFLIRTPESVTSGTARLPAAASAVSLAPSSAVLTQGAAVASNEPSAGLSTSKPPGPPLDPPRARTAALTSKASSQSAPASADRSCTPPYVIDSTGIRVFKPECL